MATVKVKFRPSTVPGRPGSIAYQLTHQRTVRLITTPYKIFPHEWDKDSASVIISGDAFRSNLLKTIAQRIKWDIERINKIFLQHPSISVKEAMAMFADEGTDKSFFKYMHGAINRLKQLGRTGTALNYQSTLNSFSKFIGNEDLSFPELTADLMEEYQAWLHARGATPNSSSFYMRNLRATYIKAVEDGLGEDQHPFKKVYTGVDKTVKRAISVDEIRRIKKLDLSLQPTLEFARDIFLFLFYAMGMSFVDAATLKKKNLQGDIIIYRRRKTNQTINVPITENLMCLINKYSTTDSEYLLPIIKADAGDELAQSKLALHRINANLKAVAKLAKVAVNLTTYVTRHSWASIARDKDIPISTISDALGHTNVKTTEIYLTAIHTDKLKKANALIFKGL